MKTATITKLRAAGLGILLASAAVTAAAADTVWVNPAVPDFGAAAALPDAGLQPDKSSDYKVVFNITGAGPNDKINPSLDRVARTVNIFVSAGVPLSHLHFIAVIHGPATPVILDNDHYKEKFSVDNPNIKLISELKTVGTQVVVCGQALAHNKFPHEWVNRDVEVTLSAISDVIILQQQGYVLFPM